MNEETVISDHDISIKIKAVHAVHAKKSFLGSLVGNGNGYILEITKSLLIYRVYVTGDSVYNKKPSAQSVRAKGESSRYHLCSYVLFAHTS